MASVLLLEASLAASPKVKVKVRLQAAPLPELPTGLPERLTGLPTVTVTVTAKVELQRA